MASLKQARFRFELKLGEGGMGEVWLATDTLLERPVGIKYPLVTSPLGVDQLLQEARLLASLNHPNITILHDFLIDQDNNRFYLVVEYVDGKSLSTIIEDGHRLPLEISLEIAQGILRALSYAHQQGIVHRVDGMPLGIVLAAARVEILSPAEIASEIGQSLDFLETDLNDLPARQRSMRAVFDHSWNLLTEQERAVFQGFSVFRGGFTRMVSASE